MKTNVENFIIIGDKISVRGNNQSKLLVNSDSQLHEISLDDDSPLYSDHVLEEEFGWYDFFIDKVFYTNHNLRSRIRASSEHVRADINLEHYFDVYISSAMQVQKYTQNKSLSYHSFNPNPSSLEEVLQAISIKKNNPAKKAKTLILDAICVNDLPNNPDNISDIITAHINGIRVLISLGYKNFIIFNVPNIINHAAPNFSELTLKFNSELASEILNLQSSHPGSNLHLFDIYTLFNENSIQLSTKNCYIGEQAQLILAAAINSQIFMPTYQLETPEQILLEQFKKQYLSRYQKDKKSICGWLVSAPSFNIQQITLEEAFARAKQNKKSRTFKTLVDLEWIAKTGECCSQQQLVKNLWQLPASQRRQQYIDVAVT